MYERRSMLAPKQPFFVMCTAHYYKYVVMNYGISHFYSFIPTSNMNNVVSIVPDGCIDMIFKCDCDNPQAYIYGTVLKYGTSNFIKGERYFGVRFLPGSALLPGKLNISDLVNSEISLWDVMKDKKMIENITHSNDFKYQIKTFMDAYSKDYNKLNIIHELKDLKKYMIDEIMYSKGNIKIETLAQECGYSTRYINKIFSDEYGLAPKAFCKMMRFQNFISSLNERGQTEDITQIALDSGYFDQSHLAKDFHTFTNLTPKKYLKEMQKSSYNNRLIIL